MSKFPEYLEAALAETEKEVGLSLSDWGHGKATVDGVNNRLREAIDRYAREAIAAAMIDRAIDAPKLARLERAVQAESESSHGYDCAILSVNACHPCDCHLARLKAALKP